MSIYTLPTKYESTAFFNHQQQTKVTSNAWIFANLINKNDFIFNFFNMSENVLNQIF